MGRIATIGAGALAVTTLGAGAAGGYTGYELNERRFRLSAAADSSVGFAFAYMIGGFGVLGCSKGAMNAVRAGSMGAGIGIAGAAMVGAAALGFLPGLVTSSQNRREPWPTS